MRFSLIFAILLLLASPVFTSEQPNFIVIFIDDMGYGDIEPFGSTANATPNLNAMAAGGMKLTSFYAAPVCSASRAQLLTGSYAPRVSVPGVFFPRQSAGLHPDEVTIADYLSEAGYATACVGKWHLGDQREFLPTRQGFDSYFGIPYSNDMQRTSTETGLRVTPLLRDEEVADLLEDEDQRRVTREYTEEAVAYIQKQAAEKNPFFLYLPHTAMHVPLFPHESFDGTSSNGVYGDWIAEVDWSVGEILKAVDDSGISEETLVLFTSDNGPWASRGDKGGVSGVLRGSKGGTLEGGVRVPTIVRWTGTIEAGAASDAITGTTDLLPTFTALAGVSLREDRAIDGFDISGVLKGDREESDREAWHYFQGTRLKAIRKGPWKLGIMAQSIGMGFKEQPADILKAGRLYHLENDIGETADVSADHPEIVAELEALAMAKAEDVEARKRPAGFVEDPVMLYPSDTPVRGTEKKKSKASKPIDWSKVQPGKVYSTDSAPQIATKPFSIEARLSGDDLTGVVLAHGGSVVGYVLYVKDEKLIYAVSSEKTVRRVSLPIQNLALPFVATAKKNELTLRQGAAVSTAPGHLISRHPQEDLSIGHDVQNAVDPQQPTAPFTGTIDSIEVSVLPR